MVLGNGEPATVRLFLGCFELFTTLFGFDQMHRWLAMLGQRKLPPGAERLVSIYSMGCGVLVAEKAAPGSPSRAPNVATDRSGESPQSCAKPSRRSSTACSSRERSGEAANYASNTVPKLPGSRASSVSAFTGSIPTM